jgi:hypothetical protein
MINGRDALRATGLIFSIALVARLGIMALVGLTNGSAGFLIEDSVQFLLEASDYVQADTLLGFAQDREAVYNPKIMPLSSAMMGFFQVVDANRLLPFIFFQIGLDSLSCVMIGLIGAAFQPRLMLPVGLVAALNPTMIVLSNLVLADSPALFFYAVFLLGGLYILKAARLGGSRGIWVGAALLCFGAVVSTYLRYVSLYASAALFLVLALTVLYQNRARAWRPLAALAVSALLTLAALQPIALRNHIAHGEFAYTFQSGVHLLYWVVPMARDLSGVQSRVEAEEEASERLTERLGQKGPNLDVFDRTTEMQSLGRTMFWETGLLALFKAWTAGAALNLGIPAIAISPPIREIPHQSFYDSPGDGAASKVIGYILAPENRAYVAVVLLATTFGVIWWGLCGLGFVSAARGNFVLTFFLASWMVFFLMITGPVVSPKYRLPLEPALCVFVGAGAMKLIGYIKGRFHAVR